jgi:hypothetical protein
MLHGQRELTPHSDYNSNIRVRLWFCYQVITVLLMILARYSRIVLGFISALPYHQRFKDVDSGCPTFPRCHRLPGSLVSAQVLLRNMETVPVSCSTFLLP